MSCALKLFIASRNVSKMYVHVWPFSYEYDDDDDDERKKRIFPPSSFCCFRRYSTISKKSAIQHLLSALCPTQRLPSYEGINNVHSCTTHQKCPALRLNWDELDFIFPPSSSCRRDMFSFPMALFHSSDWYCFAPKNSLSISWNLSAVGLKSLDVYPLAVVFLDMYVNVFV